ncbi:ankyrin repeat and LEM domain-containing protein 1 isoform X2 [Mobula hypostoma]|uniref:ankyrin repeat and LEM domain-containing protein 1 isoform X2 n=1 Tax=Mobula hypostoma TaxID=723540 RepID=UPI002FC3B929
MMNGEHGVRRLHRALRQQDSRSLEKWLKEGADPSLVLPEGIAAIHLAVGQDTEGAVRCLKLLLQYGADPNVRSSEDLTPLHVAASWGCIKCVKLLLRNGADPSLLDQEGQSAIDLAREQGNVKCCQILQQYQDYSLLEDTAEDVPAFRYVGFRRVSSALCSFTNLAELGVTDSVLPGKPEEFDAVSRTWKTLSEGQWEFVSSAGALRNGSGGPLGEVTSVWSQACGQSISTKPPSLCEPSGIPEDGGEGKVGEDAEHASCVLLSTSLSRFGKFEEQALEGLVSEADSLKDHSPSDQDFRFQDAQGFVPETVRLLSDTSADDDSFLPPSAPGTPLPGIHRSATSTCPHPVTAEHSCAPQTLAVSLEEKEVFQGGGLTGNTEWLSELDCTCPLMTKSQSYVSPSNGLNMDSELLVRLPRGKGIDVTSPDHIYEFTHSSVTFLTDLDKTTAVIEGSLDHSQVSDRDGSLHIECVQSESGVSTSGDSPYRSCVSDPEVLASSVGNFSHMCRPQLDREDLMIPTDEGCLSTPAVSSAGYGGSSPSRCRSGIVLRLSDSVPRCNVSQRCPDSRQTPQFNGVQLIDENPAASPLSGGTVRSMYCLSSQTQCTAGQQDSPPAKPGARGSGWGGVTCTSGCWGRVEKEAMVPGDGIRSLPLMTPAEGTEEQSEPESRRARGSIPIGSQVEGEGVLGSSVSCSLSDQGPGGVLGQGDESNTRASSDQEHLLLGDGAVLQMRSMNIRPSEGGQPSFEQSLSPFVTIRTRKRLANPAPQICDSSLFDQSIPMPTRTRRVRRQQEDAGTRSSWFCPSGSVSRDGEGEDGSLSPTNFSAEEDADFDTVPFVLCDGDKPASGQALESAAAHTVPFSIEREAGVLPLSCDEHGNRLSLRRRGLASSGEEQQTPALPPRESPAEPEKNQVGPLASGQVGPTLGLNGAVENERCDPALKAVTLCSPAGTVKVADGSSVSGLAEFPGIPRHRSMVCPCLVPLSGGLDAQGWYCGMPECASSSRSEDPRAISNHSTGLVASQLSHTECEGPLSDHPVSLSPGGRPVSCGAGEAVEYLYTDAKGSPALIECCLPSRDVICQNTTTPSPEDTILYDWKAYRRAEEKENIPQSDEGLPPHLQLLSNRQILGQLREYGEDPGPVTDLTRAVYLLRLHEVQKQPRPRTAGYSPELAQSLEKFVFPDCSQDEMALVQQFDQPDPKRRWREGVVKSSFNYLLLDPRVTKNLPTRCHVLCPAECFRTFISSIFYVGKGKRSRSYSHVCEALKHFKGGNRQVNAKLKHIMDIWESGHGVISLHCFQNVIPVEAYTREACMVDALSLRTLTNRKRGDYYGLVATWPLRRRRQLGVHMLKRAMEILLAEGERQLRPADV